MSGKRRPQRHHFLVVMSLFLLTIASSVVTMRAYINNSKEAKARYDALIAVDTAGGDVEAALKSLRSYIYAHMNTTIGSPTGVYPPIQLKGTYDRLVDAEKARVKAVNDDLYNKAQKDCEIRFPNGLSGSNRIPCITEYVTQNAVKEQPIPEGLYKYDFVSPRWSPDTAGFGILISTTLAGTFLYQLATYRRLRHLLHLSQ